MKQYPQYAIGPELEARVKEVMTKALEQWGVEFEHTQAMAARIANGLSYVDRDPVPARNGFHIGRGDIVGFTYKGEHRNGRVEGFFSFGRIKVRLIDGTATILRGKDAWVQCGRARLSY